MQARLLGYLAAFLILASALEGCAIINTMVSLKYEVGYPAAQNECVSRVSGQNLCLALKRHQALALGCFTAWAALCGFAILRKQPGE